MISYNIFDRIVPDSSYTSTYSVGLKDQDTYTYTDVIDITDPDMDMNMNMNIEIPPSWWTNRQNNQDINHSRILTILRGCTAIISAISSFTFMYLIIRSSATSIQEPASTSTSRFRSFIERYKSLGTQNRLLLGLCMGDIMHSIGYTLLNVFMPKDVSYAIWNARGNETSCAIQGMIQTMGWNMSNWYNCTLCLYFLAVVRQNKSDEYIQKHYETYYHALPIGVVVIFGIIGLVGDTYNAAVVGDGMAFCISPKYMPPHCKDVKDGAFYEDEWDLEDELDFNIPCGQGLSGRLGTFFILMRVFLTIIIPVFIMGICLTLIYKTVRVVERKSELYGISRLALQPDEVGTTSRFKDMVSKATQCWKRMLYKSKDLKREGEEDASRSSTSSSRGLSYSNHIINGNGVQNGNGVENGKDQSQVSVPCASPNRNAPKREDRADDTPFSRLQRERSRNLKQKSRSVMYKAMAYTAAWLLVVMWVLLATFLPSAYESSGSGEDESNGNIITAFSTFYLPVWLTYPAVIFAPLQGLYNLMIYLYPKVIAAKQKSRKKYQRRGAVQPEVTWWQAFVSVVSPTSSNKKRKQKGDGKKVSKKPRSRSKPKIAPAPHQYADGYNSTAAQISHQHTPRSAQDNQHAESKFNMSQTRNISFVVEEAVNDDDDVSVDADVDLASSVRMSRIDDESLLSVRSSIVLESSNIGISYATEHDEASC
mmetsp:Transcript_16731/g.25134  ORF Transcript_16731/g.25134 Transcript_16731/m.25134 type:complete len:708 (-) Transcript_16731:210-2333(-)|eukprot:CAMPEP_0194108936 /NCGR_PEP_ID=MMETSP0150-20130528/8554_1 /TAXON_ID=122233 /ORGANISM="Chaetoceros debilis, Strain MM31A-1" /LENGTH=707 /DNA_ID=CAMNT_0038797767 /DNA_START=404 /DNA_END=2527 /DNA_ORIENTATION=-